MKRIDEDLIGGILLIAFYAMILFFIYLYY